MSIMISYRYLQVNAAYRGVGHRKWLARVGRRRTTASSRATTVMEAWLTGKTPVPLSLTIPVFSRLCRRGTERLADYELCQAAESARRSSFGSSRVCRSECAGSRHLLPRASDLVKVRFCVPHQQDPSTRRQFLSKTLAAASGAGVLAAASREEQALLAWAQTGRPEVRRAVQGLPCGGLGS